MRSPHPYPSHGGELRSPHPYPSHGGELRSPHPLILHPKEGNCGYKKILVNSYRE
jgi:hypothetical protein